MARSRNLKPAFFMNEDLADLDPLTRLLFAGLWTLADREGRLENRPKRIKAGLLPYDNCDPKQMLTDLNEEGFIHIYGENSQYIQIVSFQKHQNPHKNEAPSTIQAPEEYGTSTIQTPEKHSTNPADSLNPLTDSLNPLKTKSRGKNGKRFIPPSLEELSNYIQENNYSVDAETFRDFYQSKNWMVGKNKMKCWQSAVRTWARKNKIETEGSPDWKAPDIEWERFAQQKGLSARPGETWNDFKRRLSQ